MLYRFDLHIHSCLSPCGDLDSSPSAIAAKAKETGLNAIMIADHNSSRNAPALAESCRREKLECLFGMELTTAEEVHVLCAFDTVEQAAALTETVYAALPKRVNQPGVFGYQVVVDADENVLDQEWRILGLPTRLTLPQAEKAVHALGGLFIGAHIDRHAFSMFSQLGGLNGDEGFDAVELTRFASPAAWKPQTRNLPTLLHSDAHFVTDIGTVHTQADLPAFTVAALREAFQTRPETFTRCLNPPCLPA